MVRSNAEAFSRMDAVILENLLIKLRNAPDTKHDEYGFSHDVPSLDHHIILIPKTTSPYASSSKRQQYRKAKRVRDFVSCLNMTECEGVSALVKRKEIRKMADCLNYTAKEANALLMTRRFTSRDMEFLRNYFMDIPTVKELRSAHWENLQLLPPLQILYDGAKDWQTMDHGRITMTSNFGRNVQAVRYNIPDFLTSRLKEIVRIDGSIKCLDLNNHPNTLGSKSVPVLFSIDSGTGTVKLMGKILLEDSSQSSDQIFLLGESCGSDERFHAMETCFGECAKEINHLAQKGIEIENEHYTFIPIFVADFKVYYSLTGGLGACSKFPCPWCSVARKHMDCSEAQLLTQYNLSDTELLPLRPNIADLRDSSYDLGKLQKQQTYNLFHLTNGKNSNFIPPPLHLKLGLVNKFIEVLDQVCVVWKLYNYWIRLDKIMSPIENHLRYALSTIKVKRQNYYSGQIDGSACVQFMKEMVPFCHIFFGTELPSGGLVSDSMPNVVNLKNGLIRISTIFNGFDGNPGLRFYLSSPKKWEAQDIAAFDVLQNGFVAEIKRTFWRRPGTFHVEEPWRRPWLMPKLHSLVAHVKPVVKMYGYFGAFSEEGMEKMQQVSKRVRNLHSPNKSLGAQIVDDLQYNAVLSSPVVKQYRREGEARCFDIGRPLRKKRFQ